MIKKEDIFPECYLDSLIAEVCLIGNDNSPKLGKANGWKKVIVKLEENFVENGRTMVGLLDFDGGKSTKKNVSKYLGYKQVLDLTLWNLSSTKK